MGEIKRYAEVNLCDIKPYSNNAKIHSKSQVEKIAESIERFGFLSPCLIDKDYNLIAGHGRLMAAELLGRESMPCIFVEGLTDEERRAYILADNRLTEMGEWDMEAVAIELEQLSKMDFDVSLTGFDEIIIEQFDTQTSTNDEYDFDKPVEIRTKRGDIWRLGDHIVMCGDSTSIDDVDKLFGGGIKQIY